MTNNWKAECITNGLLVKSPDGIQYEMNHVVGEGDPKFAYWYTTKIIDKNNNYALITYNGAASSEINTVTTSDGRTLSFYYEDNLTNFISNTTPRRLYKISDNNSHEVTYNYTPINYQYGTWGIFLTTVTKPDFSKWNYEYKSEGYSSSTGYNPSDPNSLRLTKIINPKKGYTTYNYGYVDYYLTPSSPERLNTVVESKTTSEGGKWTYSYTPGDLYNYDTTVVKTPINTITYKHIGLRHLTDGSVWQNGLLISKSIDNLQSETYSWDKIKISDQNVFPPYMMPPLDVGTYMPILKQKTINRDGKSYITNYSNFNIYGAPQTIQEIGSAGTKITDITYYNHLNKWVINKLKSKSTYLQYSTEKDNLTNEYDNNANLASVDSNGIKTSYTYDNEGNIYTITDPKNVVTYLRNYKRGIPQSETSGENITISRLVNDTGTVNTLTDANGYKTIFTYDELNRIKTITKPKGNYTLVTHYSYNNSFTVSRGNYLETITLDEFDRIKSRNKNGIIINYRYDLSGRNTFISLPNSTFGDQITYDGLNRKNSLTHTADNTYQRWVYGADQVTFYDEKNNGINYQYANYANPDEGIIKTVTPATVNAKIDITRNIKNQVKTIKQNNLVQTFNYDNYFYIKSKNIPEQGLTTYISDLNGNIIQKTKSSSITQYTYDSRNRLKSITYNDVNTPAESFTYDNLDRLKTATSGTVVKRYNYDENSNLLDETLNIDNLNLKVSYSYDANDYLSDMSYPDPKSEKLFYFPDNLGRPTKVHPLASIDAYYPNGNLKDFYYANDIQTHNTLDNRQRPESTIITAHFLTSNKSVIYNTKNLYEPNNNIKSITDLTGSSIYDRQFTYDNLDRLSGINLFGALDTNITYNANGDIVKNNTTNNLDYTYNVNHQLSSISGTKNYSFTYDHWGNITNNGRNSFAYNDAQNLRCIDCNTSTATTYLYDTNHYRVKSKKNNISTYYFYNKDGLLLLEYTPAKSTAKQFAYIGNKLIAMRRVYSSTLDLDLDGIADAKEINESATSITNGEDLTYYHSDANGSIIGAANHPAGNTIFTESYAPYGEQFFNTINPLLKNPSSIWFAGKQRDESGLLYFGARYYDPEIGRFMSIDPISTDPLNIHSFNRYAYANNNPYKFTDPDGRDPIKMIFTPITNIGDNPAVQGYFQDIYSQNKKNYDFPGINKTVTAHIGTLDEVVADAKKSYGFNIKKEDYSLNSDTPAGALAINPYNIYIISDQINFNLTRWSGSILGHELVHTNQFEKGTLPLLSEPGNPLKSAQAEIEAYTWQLQTVKKFGLTQLSIDTIQSGINANLAVEARLEH